MARLNPKDASAERLGRFAVDHHPDVSMVIRQIGERIWLVAFMQYDLGYFDDETCRLEPIANPFDPKVLPMCSE